ncbi:fasciclin-like arabinogalactan protein 17 [Ananas comosus]|uniref:Fasciclin-like arabinogalactan protein 17 n=1 Tax=Ananas comosus TaxID=4615 RepID=A0A6P5F7Y2_ANACO|nr:fasciclin-like arabinogalactan protein 17 [Ananas comosus]
MKRLRTLKTKLRGNNDSSASVPISPPHNFPIAASVVSKMSKLPIPSTRNFVRTTKGIFGFLLERRRPWRSRSAAELIRASSSSSSSSPSSSSSSSGGGGSGVGINSNSVLVALLDSHYTELAELVEKALLLQTLEDAVGRHNLTVFAPRNDALDRDLDPEFKRFLLEPRNLRSLQTLILFHCVTHRLKKPAPPVPPGSPPALPIFDAMAPGPSLAPAPAPGPGSGKHWFDGESQVKDFIQTLLLYGGYNELADILVNLTSLATEMGRLVSEGYVLTVLAPNDEAMARLTTDQLSEPGAPEQIVYYHLIPEYQTEESMYNAVRRFGKVRYDTLRLPHKVVAREADGSVKFGQAEGSAYLFDPDIYTDGRISVQGIDAVLFPPDQALPPGAAVAPADRKPPPLVKRKPKPKPTRRGKLLEAACQMLGGFGQRFSSCQS